MLEHGGRLQRASAHYGIALADWLDLSTGISPLAWPVPAIPPRQWQRLPEDDDGLLGVARDYYAAPHLLAVAGSQAAIQQLPQLRPASRVGILAPGYAEHAHAWGTAGHAVERVDADTLLQHPDRYDVIVLIHPNNPGSERFELASLRRLHAGLAARGGWLVVDEAFIDATPEHSLCPYSGIEGLVVLRSVGKFFGLAGARAGFVAAWPALLQALRQRLGPWTVSGPTRYVLIQALADRAWQDMARQWLQAASHQLADLLARHGLPPAGGCQLFQWCCRADAAELHVALARRGIFTRWFEQPASLRFGLPPDAASFARLDRALHEIGR